jgi:hypothetical protein
MCTECMQKRGSNHEESDSDYIGIPLAEIFEYDGEDTRELLLEKNGAISMATSSGTGR